MNCFQLRREMIKIYPIMIASGEMSQQDPVRQMLNDLFNHWQKSSHVKISHIHTVTSPLSPQHKIMQQILVNTCQRLEMLIYIRSDMSV